jgi:hypothetical protein
VGSVAPPPPGTVLAVQTTGWAAWWIRFGAAVRNTPNINNHIAVVHHTDAKGVTYVIEGKPGGVGQVDATQYLESRWTLTNELQPMTSEQGLAVAQICEAMLGTAYDWEAIVDDGLKDLDLWAPRLGVVHGETVCSALAAYAYDKVGLKRPLGQERLIQPADWDTWIITEGWTPGRST